MKNKKHFLHFVTSVCTIFSCIACKGGEEPGPQPVPPTPVIDDGGIDLTYMRMNATTGAQVKFNYTYTSETDDIKVYWGDGTVDSSNHHKYSNPGRYHIYITGHINNIALSDETGKKYAADNIWITDVIFSNHVTNIPTKAFNVENGYLQSVLIPKTVKTIGSEAFVRNSTKIYCFEDKREDGWEVDCFYGVDQQNIVFGLNLYLQDDNILYAAYDKNGEKFATVYTCCDLTLKDAIIKDKIIINNNEHPVISIWESAFYGMETLLSLVVPSSVKQIDKFAFVDCKNLETITLNEGLRKIGASAFKNTGITSVVLPSSIDELGDVSFGNCSKLQSVTFKDNSELTQLESGIFDRSNNINDLKLWQGLKSLKMYSIRDLAIKELHLPSTVTSLESYAFHNCRLLETIDATAFKDINSIPSALENSFSYANIDNTVTIKIASGLNESDFTAKGWPKAREASSTTTGIKYVNV